METSSVEKKLTLGMITRTLKLSKLQIRNLFSLVLRSPVPPDTDEIEPRVLLFLLTADLFEKLAFLKPVQNFAILTDLMDGLYSSPALFQQLNQLMFADSQYCTWTGRVGFLDLETGETVQQLQHPPMESIGYNLSELYRRGRLLIENRSGLHVEKHRAGSVDEQGNICLGPADDVFGSVRDGGPDMGPDNDHA